MGVNTLNKASRYFKAGRYDQVLRLLEPQVFRYRESYRFYYFLGISCLHTGDFGGAFSYLRRCIDLKADHIEALLGMAVIYLKKQDNAEAITQWLAVLDSDPKNKIASRGLKILKNLSGQEDQIEFMDAGKFKKLIPGPRKIHPVWTASLSAVIAGAILFFLIPVAVRITGTIGRVETRPEISAVTVESGTSWISDNDAETLLTFREREIQRIFEDAKDAFHKFDDNAAQYHINRILLSNASRQVKDKARLLEKYIKIPSFQTMRTNYTYQDVSKNKRLYNNCHVIWQGRVSNLVIGEDKITFDLLVGYEDSRVLEGIVPVRLSFGARIDPGYPIQVLGKIQLSNSSLTLEGVSVHHFTN